MASEKESEVKLIAYPASCEACGKDLDFEPQYCCNAYDCGCAGKPIDPPVCSEACYEKLWGFNEQL